VSKLSISPSTTEIYQEDGSVVRWVGQAPTLEPAPHQAGLMALNIPIGTEIKTVFLNSVAKESSEYIEATTEPSGNRLVVRASNEYDVVGSKSVPSKIPLPIRVIEGLVSSVEPTTPIELNALADDQGFVSTLLLDSPNGMYVRYSRVWIELNDPEIIHNLDVYTVADEALDLYDQYDQVGRSVHVGSLPITDAEDKMRANRKAEQIAMARESAYEEAETLEAEADAASEAVTAAALPVIVSPEQLVASIQVGVEDPSIRWYIEKRAAALNVPVEELPWKTDGQ
jgi:hypothetical protein